MVRHQRRSTLFPYTTLFRSGLDDLLGGLVQLHAHVQRRGRDHGMDAAAAGELDGFGAAVDVGRMGAGEADRKSTRLNSSHGSKSYAVFCLKKKKIKRANAHQ